jgi:undecaprenyl diphosphate synthase
MPKNSSVPGHVAIIMDGNGRWAQSRNLPRIEGHKAGVKVVKIITQTSAEFGIKYLTLYAFSTENWKRDKTEVDFLFNLFVDAVTNYLAELVENSVKLNFIGNISGLPYFVRKFVDYSINKTSKCNRMTLNVALNYGGREEIINAVRKICKSGANVDEKSFEDFLYTKGQPDPDLIIRTGGEKRLSNFLLYQSFYSELFFTNTYWPDFSKEEYIAILNDFMGKRQRRFGGVK